MVIWAKAAITFAPEEKFNRNFHSTNALVVLMSLTPPVDIKKRGCLRSF
jgi:hypothetical protein